MDLCTYVLTKIANREGDTGYNPSILNWALSGGGVGAGLVGGRALWDNHPRPHIGAIAGALTGSTGGALSAYLAKRKLRRMRENEDEAKPSTWGSLWRGAALGAGAGAAGGAGLGLAEGRGRTGAGALGGGAFGALLGGLLGIRAGSSQRVAARRAGLMRDPGDNEFAFPSV